MVNAFLYMYMHVNTMLLFYIYIYMYVCIFSLSEISLNAFVWNDTWMAIVKGQYFFLQIYWGQQLVQRLYHSLSTLNVNFLSSVSCTYKSMLCGCGCKGILSLHFVNMCIATWLLCITSWTKTVTHICMCVYECVYKSVWY